MGSRLCKPTGVPRIGKKNKHFFFLHLLTVTSLRISLKRDPLYESARAAMTKYYRRNDLNNTNLYSHSSRGWKSKIKVPELVSGESFLPRLQWATFLPCPHMKFPLCVSAKREERDL